MVKPPQMDDFLDVLCPMHVRLDDAGYIVHVGPTLQKLRAEEQLEGRRFLDVVELLRPRRVTTMAELLNLRGMKLHFQMRGAPRTALKGVMVPQGAGAIVNLSFGIGVIEAVRDYALTSADFSATDLTIEMLYLVEAKSAAMEASRKLNLRLQGAKIAAEEQAFTDTLTGLKNRRAMDHVLSRLLETGQEFALMHLDLDFFKEVNDTLGHAAGDHVLQRVARVLVEETREEDTVVRVGGDEFVLIFHKLTDRAKLEEVARRMIDRLEKPIPFEGKTCRISGSIGTALTLDREAPTAAAMIDDADVALYASKRAGRACHTFYRPELRDPPPQPLPSGRDQPEGKASATAAR